MREVVYFILPYLGCSLLFFLVRQVLPSKVSVWKVFLYLLPIVLNHVPKYIWGSGSIKAQGISLMFMIFVLVGYPILLYTGPKWKRILTVLFFYALQTSSDIICYAFFFRYDGAYAADVELYTLSQMVSYTVASLSVFAAIGSLGVLLFRFVSMRRFQSFYVVFLVFPVSQLVVQFYCLYPDYSASVLFLGVVLGLAAELALLGYIISQESKAALEAELRETRYNLARERIQYQAAEEQRARLAQIRHDFNNQLAVIELLARNGEREDAERMIQSLKKDINDNAGGGDAYA